MNTGNIAIGQLRPKGMLLVLTGASLWGISGTVAQYLFQHQGFSPGWLVVIRLLISGTILLGIAAGTKQRDGLWGIWKDKNDVISILLFSIFGMLAVQYTYFAAIGYSNAATATVLQYLAPVIIACFLAIRLKRIPTSFEIIAIILAIGGTYLLVTGGHYRSLSITGWAIFWGLSSAVALAFYTLQPHKLLAKWGSTTVIGWGMLIGGLSFSFIHPPWNVQGNWTLTSFFAVVFIVIFGTLIAFYCYLESLKYISATETSLLACIEPLSAALLSIIWLQVSFGLTEWLGTLFILSTIMILSLVKDDAKQS